MRAFWKGAVNFGVMSIPVRVYKAQEDEKSETSMRMLCPCHEQPIKMPRRCSVTDEQILNGEAKHGYEVSRGQFVQINDDEQENLPLTSLRAIELEQFIVPPGRSALGLYAQGSYYLEPEEAAARAYLLLRKALETSGKWAVGKIAFKGRERLCVIQPHGKGLILTTVAWPDNVRNQNELKLPDEGTVSVSAQELAMAQSFIEELTSPFEPATYHDEYASAFKQLISEKIAAGAARPVVLHPAPAKPVPDVLEALKASVEAARSRKRSKVA